MVLYDQDPDIIRWGLHLLLPGGVVGGGGGASTDNSAHHHTQTTTSTPYSAYALPLQHANGDSSNSTEINVEHVARDDAVTTSTPYSAYALPLQHANGDSSNSTEINVEHVARDDAVTTSTPYSAYALPLQHANGDSSNSTEINVEHVARNDAVNNDEIIAQALQEELSQIALAEASGASSADDNHSAVLTQQWFRPRTIHVASGTSPASRQAESREEPFSSCSSPGDDNAQHGDACLIDLMDDFSVLDGEVGKRLNDMVPVPHVPKTNGEIPSVDESISDHQRLLDRLVLYGLVELKVKGDGNCQFRALSDQFYRTPEHHRFVRQQVVKQLESHPEFYAGYVPMDYREYLKKMSKSGEWGDHVTLQAAADSYGVKVFILTSFKDTCYIEILPVAEKSRRVICLSFWAEVHYNSIYPEGELPVLENKKKSWWPL